MKIDIARKEFVVKTEEAVFDILDNERNIGFTDEDRIDLRLKIDKFLYFAGRDDMLSFKWRMADTMLYQVNAHLWNGGISYSVYVM